MADLWEQDIPLRFLKRTDRSSHSKEGGKSIIYYLGNFQVLTEFKPIQRPESGHCLCSLDNDHFEEITENLVLDYLRITNFELFFGVPGGHEADLSPDRIKVILMEIKDNSLQNKCLALSIKFMRLWPETLTRKLPRAYQLDLKFVKFILSNRKCKGDLSFNIEEQDENNTPVCKIEAEIHNSGFDFAVFNLFQGRFDGFGGNTRLRLIPDSFYR